MQQEINIKEWSDLTIRDVKKIMKIKIPDKLMDLYNSKTPKEYQKKYSKFLLDDFLKFAEFYGEMILMLTDITDVKYMQWHDRQTIYETHLRDFVIEMLLPMPNYQPKGIKFFEYNKVKYFLPKELKLLGEVIPGYDEKAMTFIEGCALTSATEGLKNGGVDKLPYFIAVYCRPEGEEYNEKKSIDRAKDFENLTMDIAWEVFFCIIELLKGSAKNIDTYIKNQPLKIKTLMHQG